MVVDLARKIQAANPWFHKYLDPGKKHHLWRIVYENVFRGQINNLIQSFRVE